MDRQRAIGFTTENSILAENNIENEGGPLHHVAGPGARVQLGQMESKLRDEAKRAGEPLRHQGVPTRCSGTARLRFRF
jgi:hypothetical protein